MIKSKTSPDGRPYATLAEVVRGTILQADGGFTCLAANDIRRVYHDADGLYIRCCEGKHYLEGQIEQSADGTEFYIGLHNWMRNPE